MSEGFLDMTPADRAALVKRTMAPVEPKTRERRAAILDRVACVEERPEVLAKAKIRRVFNDSEIADEVCRFTSSLWNPLLNLSARIAQGYAHPPIRRVPDNEEAEAKLLAFLEGPVRFDSRAKGWHLKSVALSTIVVLVVPRQRRGKPCFDFRVVHGGAAEVVQEPFAVFGDTPKMLAYCLHRPGENYAKLRHDVEVVCVVDGHGYHYCTENGDIKRTEPHGLTRFPGAVLRSAEPEGSDDDDWWGWRAGNTMVAGTADYGMIGAMAQYARKTQYGKVITISRPDPGELVEPIEEEGQVRTPEGAIETVGGDISVEDFEAPIEGFLKHQASILQEVSRRTTGSSRMLDDQLLTETESAQRHAVLLGLQRDQHAILGPFEQEILELMAEMGEVYGVEGFPTLSELESFETQFVPLTHVSTPEARLKWYMEASAFGVTDQVVFLQEMGWSERDARKHLKRIASRRAELHEIQAERNSPADPLSLPALIRGLHPAARPGERPEAITGRAGGIESGMSRNENRTNE